MKTSVGKVCWSVFPYYDAANRSMSFKRRPVLIVGDESENDYTVLPISSITRRENLNPEYDVEVDPLRYPLLGLSRRSYVRTHKQIPVHKAEIVSETGDMKGDYEELFLSVLLLRDRWNERLTNDAL